MKIKVDFYADTFRGGEMEVPDELREADDRTKRDYMERRIAEILYSKNIRPRSGGEWKGDHGFTNRHGNFVSLASNDGSVIKIITSKYI